MISVNSMKNMATADGLADGRFDLSIFAASWDTRCLAVTYSEEYSTIDSILVSYTEKGFTGRSQANEGILADFLGSHSTNPVSHLELDSFNVLRGFSDIRALLIRSYNNLGRPLRVIVDLTSIPRYVTLALLAFGIRSGIVASFETLYAVANQYEYFDSEPPAGDPHGFTMGSWRPIPIAGLGVGGKGQRPSHLLVSLGFDGAKTRKLVDVLEPSSITTVIAGDPGEDLFVRAHRENSQLIAESSRLIAAPAHELAVCVTLIKESVAQAISDDYETAILIAGPKLHSLALAVVALQIPVSNFYYIVPTVHRESSASQVSRYCHVALTNDWVESAWS